MKLFRSIKALNKRTKIEAFFMILLMIAISLSSVFGNPDGSDMTITYIKNGNGSFWVVANATNLQESLDQGGVTYFPATTIYTNKTIKIPSYASLIGTGMNSILKADTGLGRHSLIQNENQTNGNIHLEVKNLVLDGSNTTHNGTGTASPINLTRYGLTWIKVSYGIVDNVWVKDTGTDGIRLLTCNNCSVTHCNAYNTGHHSIFFGYGTSYSSVSDLIVTNSAKEAAVVEWLSNYTTGKPNHLITISNVIAKNCGQYGIFVRDAYSVTVTGCLSENSDDDGFYAGNCHEVVFTNCITNNNRQNAGFRVKDNANGVILSNCIARHAGYETTTACKGFELQGQNIQMSNCEVYDTSIPFNFNLSTAKNITISMCNIVDYTKPSNVNGDNIQFRDNTFHTHTITPCVLDINSSATNILVNDNDFRYAPTSYRKINDLSGTAIIYDNINGSSEPPAPPETLDQQQTNYSLNYSMYTTRWGGQSFKPSLGVLSSVDLYMRRVGSPPSDVTLSVRNSLSGSDLVSISIPSSNISASYGWVKFDFSDLNVTTGTYYLVLRTSGGSTSNRYYWGYGYHTPYTNGIRVYSSDGGITWVNNPSYDNCFKTYGI